MLWEFLSPKTEKLILKSFPKRRALTSKAIVVSISINWTKVA